MLSSFWVFERNVEIDDCSVMARLQSGRRDRNEPAGLMLDSSNFQPDEIVARDSMKKVEKMWNLRTWKIVNVIDEQIDCPLGLQGES
ncbi:hypothetical protein WK26_20765 [Burkholderia vietnamiensis]|nr:hypothetical protein WK26_20765 [Burkholderia vietnamiensis]KVS37042.1 hypothetical protein WK35_02355 [Burkholderia vietnamiensis]